MSEAVKPKPATYQDVLDAPPGLTAEVLNGELVLSPRPASRHTTAGTLLGADLASPFSRKPGSPFGPGGWHIRDEPELHLSDHIIVPDVAGWRRERMPTYEEGPFVTLAPDFVCEVLSPSTFRRDRFVKMDLYRREGVEWMWLVDPERRTVDVYRREDAHWVVAKATGFNTVARLPPFDAVEIDLARWWGETPDPPETP